MFIHDDCNKKLADNCLKRIEFYREHIFVRDVVTLLTGT